MDQDEGAVVEGGSKSPEEQEGGGGGAGGETEGEGPPRMSQQIPAGEEEGTKKEEEVVQTDQEELTERQKNIGEWMEKLARIKREEYEHEEAAMVPLRHYLMAYVVPTLTKGLLEVTKVRPDDPVEFLAEFCFQHNPANINNIDKDEETGTEITKN